MKLELSAAITDHAPAEARLRHMAPMAIAAFDARGVAIVSKMEDGSSLLRPQIAAAKFWRTHAMGFGTRNLAGRAAQLPVFFAALSNLAGGRVPPVPGGVMVRDETGSVIGAIGASGDIADNEEACVLAGIEAVGLRAEAGELSE